MRRGCLGKRDKIDLQVSPIPFFPIHVQLTRVDIVIRKSVLIPVLGFTSSTFFALKW